MVGLAQTVRLTRDQRDARVLVVDDSAAIHARISDLLSECGVHDVYHAASAEEAIRFYTTQRPDLVLTDMLMPKSDGAALTKELLAWHPRGRIVVVTALPDDHPRVTEALSYGARGLVAKPITREALGTALRDALAA